MSLQTLVIDDEKAFGEMMALVLQKEGYSVTVVDSAEQGLEHLETHATDLVLCDLHMPGMDGMGFLRAARERGLECTTIMMSAYGTPAAALEAMKLGAYDYISKPFNRDEIILVLRKAEERERLREENRSLRLASSRDLLVGESERMRALRATIERVSQVHSTVLITGESGTGKERVARAIHELSPRAGGPFLALHCGAIPANLLESELFGHVKGAFTGAQDSKAGVFEMAKSGTLLLDEIGELPLPLQVKLLRVLQEREVRPVGATHPIPVHVRIVAATSRDLQEAVEQGEFRADLFYRLHVIPVVVPPLRERLDDLGGLCTVLIERLNRELGQHVAGLSDLALARLSAHGWPGNVRELENALERAMVLSDGSTLEEEQFEHLPSRPTGEESIADDGVHRFSIKKAQRAMEMTLIAKALEETAGNRAAASRLLEISPRALLYKIKEYGISVPGKESGGTL